MNDNNLKNDSEIQSDYLSEITSNDTNWEDKYKRALADYQNLIRQQAKEREGFIKYANQNIISDLLPILDHLNSAYLHIKDKGVEMVIGEINQLLNNYSVEIIKPKIGDKFDHTLHECVETIENDVEESETIAIVQNFGYKWFDGNVIRHAQVKVFKNNLVDNKNTLDSN